MSLAFFGACGRSASSLQQGDRICLVGNALAERMQHDGWFETLLQGSRPDLGLTVRNLGYAGDEVGIQLRSAGFGSMEENLRRSRADVVLAFFGYNESFAGLSSSFSKDLRGFLRRTHGVDFGGGNGPARVVLCGPIACEDRGDGRFDPECNQELEQVSNHMAYLAAEEGVRFVDLFSISQDLYARFDEPLTINGIHLTEQGNRELALAMGEELLSGGELPPLEQLESLRAAVIDKDFHWFHRYRTTDGYSIFGARGELAFVEGQTNREVMNRELEVLDAMTDNRDRRIQALARRESDPGIDDSGLPPFLPVQTNIPGPGPGEAHQFLGGEEAIQKMELADGLRVELFASEERFPDLVNPAQMAVDPDGRVWVGAWPSYPHWKPGAPYDDKLLILPDDDGDGKADRCVVFADGLHNPTGFEFWGGGVLVAQVPDLWFLQDTDGDDVADVRQRILHGIDSADTHHSVNSFVIGQDGWLYMQEGTFHHTQVEVPFGPPVRCANAGVFRYDPRSQRFEVYASYPFANPHGHVFDAWGRDIVTDGTGAQPYFGPAISGHVEFPMKHRGAPLVYSPRTRPCPATAILSSGHFPESMQGEYLVANVIGVQGILRYDLQPDGAGLSAVEKEPLLVSSDPNFRPVDLEIGVDGALYFTDWQNPIIGHMQHNLRDPSRDRLHGRVYRVVHEEGETVREAPRSERSVAALVADLADPADPVRYRSRLELSARPDAEVLAAGAAWLAKREQDGVATAHDALELLWLQQRREAVDLELLDRLLSAEEPLARGAAVRVAWGLRREQAGMLSRIVALAEDPDPGVRLEVVRACSYFEQGDAIDAVLKVGTLPMGRYLRYVYDEALRTLLPHLFHILRNGMGLEQNPQPLLALATTESLLQLPRTIPVCWSLLRREGVPATVRRDALAVLAAREEGDASRPLVYLLGRAGGAEDFPESLALILLECSADELRGQRAELEQLSASAPTAYLRRVAWAARMVADGGLPVETRLAELPPATLLDVLGALELRAASGGGAIAAAAEELTSLARQLPDHLAAARGPGLEYDYFEASRFADARRETFAAMQPLRRGSFERVEHVVPGRRNDRYGLHYRGQLELRESGSYTFYLRSDDGSRLYVGDRQLIDNDGNHGPIEKSVTVRLEAGARPIEVTWFDSGGGDALDLHWIGPSFGRRPVASPSVTRPLGAELAAAAVRALASLPLDADVDAVLLEALGDGARREAAVAVLLRQNQAAWTGDRIARYVEAVRAVATALSEEERREPAGECLFELGNELASRSEPAAGDALRRELAALAPVVVRLRSVPEAMDYDRERFAVVAGRPVRIVFENPDQMQHNLLIVEPGAVEEVGMQAETMGPKGVDAQWVPDNPKILWSTPLLNPGDRYVLDFVAPEQPGDYGVVCTFPGHWRVMQAVMEVR